MILMIVYVAKDESHGCESNQGEQMWNNSTLEIFSVAERKKTSWFVVRSEQYPKSRYVILT